MNKAHKVVGIIFIFGILLIFILVVINLIIGLSTRYGIKVPNFEPLLSIQKRYYFGNRNVWQYMSDCVEVDQYMIYIPKNGNCKFENIEFETVLSFDSEGRSNDFPYDPNLPSIAVLGDSHAMGWGVNNNETFSAQLQNLTGRRVYNLAVSSYATERELNYLKKMNVLSKVDTIIIQYCDNDLKANLIYPINRSIGLERYLKATESYLANKKKSLVINFISGLAAVVPQNIKNFIKQFLGLELSEIQNHNVAEHRHNIEHILMEFSDILNNKRIIVFFISGSNKIKSPGSDWNGSFNKNNLNVNFVDLGIKDDYFYSLDDHLTSHGHFAIAKEIFKLIKTL